MPGGSKHLLRRKPPGALGECMKYSITSTSRTLQELSNELPHTSSASIGHPLKDPGSSCSTCPRPIGRGGALLGPKQSPAGAPSMKPSLELASRGTAKDTRTKQVSNNLHLTQGNNPGAETRSTTHTTAPIFDRAERRHRLGRDLADG